MSRNRLPRESQAASGNALVASALPVPQRLVLSGDGAFVGLVKGAWAEVRTLVIGAVDPAASSQHEVRAHTLSYFSRMTDAATFAELAEVETRATRGRAGRAGLCCHRWSRMAPRVH